jgi:nitric-oxide synthase, bacterial
MRTLQDHGSCPARIGAPERRSVSSRWFPPLLLVAAGLAAPGAAVGVLELSGNMSVGTRTLVGMLLGLVVLSAGVGVCAGLLGAVQAGRDVHGVGGRRWGSAPGARRTASAGAGPDPATDLRVGDPLDRSRRDPSPAGEVDRAAAKEFLELFHAENPEAGPARPRIVAVMSEIDLTGTYRHTAEELEFGARAAWRNNARCIGRLYWRSLNVRDLRTVSDAAGVAAHCFDHLRAADNGGKIRPMISVFAPDAPSRPGPRIWNEQLIRYAGYELPDGQVVGDPRYRTFTSTLIDRGWRPPERPGAFDVLPLVVETVEEGPLMFELPPEVVHEVSLEHPELDWFADLGLRWHAVPVISNSRLVIGGISYPAAPFNGWYMGTEIGARNLGDSDRYDLVPTVAKQLGLDTSHEATLWRDQALVEINRAVLHSFRTSGVSITDHHTESRRFLTHLEREEQAGRRCPADWSWIVPPMSGSQTPVFHRYYDADHQVPNFVADDDATHRALHGGPPAFPR